MIVRLRYYELMSRRNPTFCYIVEAICPNNYINIFDVAISNPIKMT